MQLITIRKNAPIDRTTQWICFFFLMSLLPFVSSGQKQGIPLDEGFVSEAIQYKVNKKPSSSNINKKKWKKSWNCFASYAVCNWSKGSPDRQSKGNFWGTKFEEQEFTELIYDLAAPGLDTLSVNTAYSFQSKGRSSIQPLDNIEFSFGSDELHSETLNVAVAIHSKNEKEQPWLLLLSWAEGSEEAPGFMGRFFLGQESFDVRPVSSEKESIWELPSQGFVFERNGELVAAIQHNPLRPQDRSVWFGSTMDQQRQMIFSAAFSVILILSDDINFAQASGANVYSKY